MRLVSHAEKGSSCISLFHTHLLNANGEFDIALDFVEKQVNQEEFQAQ